MGDKPRGWDSALLSDAATVIMGQSPPSSEVAETPLRYPFLQGNADFGERVPVARAWIDAPPKVAPPGASLISVRAPVGALNRADQSYAIGRGLSAVVAKNGRAEPDYIYRVLSVSDGYFVSRAQGTTFDAINRADLRELPLILPPLPEQRKIAAILSSVDDAITATRKVIEQTERVKQGLLLALMTRGIGHTRFKQTEIGEIPEEWEVMRLEEVARRGSGHTPSKTHPEYWDGGIKWVSLADSHRLDRVYISETEHSISEAGIANSSAVAHPPGTVLVSRDASVGKSAIATCELAVSQHFIAWQTGARLNNHYLYYYLQHHKPQFERIAVGNTVKTIGLAYFKALMIALPPRAEQERIAESLLSLEQVVWTGERDGERLQLLKRGLLQDLLTGRVRVTPD